MIKQLDFYTRFILYGRYGTGKTTCGCTAPKPIALIDADAKARNQVNIRSMVQSGDIDIYPFDYPLVAGGDLDYIMKPEVVNKIPSGYQEFVNLTNKIVKEEPKEYATILIDSGTRIIQHLIQLTTAVNNKTQMTQNLWGVFYTELANRLTRLNTMPINFVWVFHERVNIDETDKHQTISPSIPGQMGDDIGTFFNEVYNTRVDESGGTHYYYLITKSNAKRNNRTSGPLALKEEANLIKIISKLDGTYIAPPSTPAKAVLKSGILTSTVKKS